MEEKRMAKNMLDYINAMMSAEGKLTMEEWTNIRNNGTPEEIEEAVRKMEEQGGYDALE